MLQASVALGGRRRQVGLAVGGWAAAASRAQGSLSQAHIDLNPKPVDSNGEATGHRIWRGETHVTSPSS